MLSPLQLHEELCCGNSHQVTFKQRFARSEDTCSQDQRHSIERYEAVFIAEARMSRCFDENDRKVVLNVVLTSLPSIDLGDGSKWRKEGGPSEEYGTSALDMSHNSETRTTR